MSHYCVKLFFTITLLFVFFGDGHAQLSRENKKLYQKADEAFDYGDYLTAIELYKKLYDADSTISDLSYKLGKCFFDVKKFRDQSLYYFKKVSTSTFPDVNYYLGKIYHSQGKFETALACYTQYKYLKSDEEHSKVEVDDLIGKCNTAMLLLSKTDNTIKINNLGSTINTEFPEYAPLIPAQGNFLLFTSRRKNDVWQKKDPLGDYFEDIYISEKTDNGWDTPKMLDTAINTDLHDAGTGISADGEKLLLYRTSKDMRSGDIYESNLINKKWSTPTMLGPIVNSPDDLETSACYSPDGENIFFSSNRPGGYGGKDIYGVKKLPNGNWGKPFNLGPTINTSYNEDAPFVHPAEKTLFFSSEGHTNMGGYDIFKSTFDENGNYGTAINLGCPVNTVDDDIFFVLNTDASLGYFSSQREGGYGSQDIYSAFFPNNNIPLNVYNIHVFDENNNIIMNSDVVVTDMENKSVYGMYKSNGKTGKVIVISAPDKLFRIAVQATGYEPLIKNISFSSDTEINFKLSTKKE